MQSTIQKFHLQNLDHNFTAKDQYSCILRPLSYVTICKFNLILILLFSALFFLLTHYVFCTQVIKMLITIFVLFTLCWLPLHTFFLILDFKPELISKASTEKMSYVYFAAHWLAMSNSFQNPIIYGFLNDNFRVSSFNNLV